MLMSETLKVQETLRRAMIERHGADDLESRFRAFDTICSATQERQDAVLDMLNAGRLDMMIVIGGYNSSNTQALARMCAARSDVLHRQPAMRDRVGHPAPRDWRGRGIAGRRMAAGRRRPHRHHCRRLHARQRRRRNHRVASWPCAAGRPRI
jgi:hypothetical protein